MGDNTRDLSEFLEEWRQLDGAQQWRVYRAVELLHHHQRQRDEAMERAIAALCGSDELAKAGAARRVRELEREHQQLRARLLAGNLPR